MKIKILHKVSCVDKPNPIAITDVMLSQEF
jgi:hypothetical protein